MSHVVSLAATWCMWMMIRVKVEALDADRSDQSTDEEVKELKKMKWLKRRCIVVLT